VLPEIHILMFRDYGLRMALSTKNAGFPPLNWKIKQRICFIVNVHILSM